MEKKDLRETIDKLKSRVLKKKFSALQDGSQYRLGFSAETALDLFISRTIRYALHDDGFVNDWIQSRRSKTQLHSDIVPLADLDNWNIDADTGNIQHDSGRFFSITGIKVRHRLAGAEREWDQPVIDQPEVGILGILTKKICGVLHFCLNAKEEPGNIDSIQLSPTVQATYSNYTMVHGGKPPHFIDYFFSPPAETVIFSKLQAEDGGRFLYKSNRNMIVLINEDDAAVLPEGFIWLTLRQIQTLIRRDNLVNSCARSVLSCLI